MYVKLLNDSLVLSYCLKNFSRNFPFLLGKFIFMQEELKVMWLRDILWWSISPTLLNVHNTSGITFSEYRSCACGQSWTEDSWQQGLFLSSPISSIMTHLLLYKLDIKLRISNKHYLFSNLLGIPVVFMLQTNWLCWFRVCLTCKTSKNLFTFPEKWLLYVVTVRIPMTDLF